MEAVYSPETLLTTNHITHNPEDLQHESTAVTTSPITTKVLGLLLLAQIKKNCVHLFHQMLLPGSLNFK